MAAYIVISRTHTRNQEALGRYSELAPTFMAGHTAKFLARFGPFEVKEGAGVEGVAIIEFPTIEEAKAWYDSPAYQEASRHRYLGADYSIIIVDGSSAVPAPRPIPA